MKRLFALLLAVMMVFSVVGCGDDDSGRSKRKSKKDKDSISSVLNDDDDDKKDDKDDENDDNSSMGSSSENISSDNIISRPAVDGSLLTEAEINALRGTKVVLATWKDPFENEDGPVCESFEQIYGIDFDWVAIDQGEYVNTLAAKIAAGQQPDIFFENGDFPGSLTVMQPLDAAKLDLNDPIWNQSLIKASTLNGHPYLVDTVANVWTELGLCVYNKNIFQNLNLATPSDLYAAGKWTFATFRELAKKISMNKGYTGAGVLDEVMLGAAGCTVFNYQNNKMSLGVDDHFVEVLSFMSQMRVDGYLKLDRFGFGDGKQGMCFTTVFGLKKRGYFMGFNPDYLGATYLPVWQEGDKQVYTGTYRGWGLIDGCKNPEAAGLFMRHYLDINNYDLQDTFKNQEVTNFFIELVSNYPDNVIYYRGPDMAKSTGLSDGRFGYAFMDKTPSQIKGYLDSQKPTMELMVKKANEIINNEIEWIKFAEGAGLISKAN